MEPVNNMVVGLINLILDLTVLLRGCFFSKPKKVQRPSKTELHNWWWKKLVFVQI